MPWIELGDHDLHYLEAGDGPPLVFLHGFGSCAEAWEQQFDALADRFRCIAYSSVNHGHSSNTPRGEPEPDRADELEGVLQALGIDRPALAGNSMGAMTLLRWATRNPDRAAALVPSGMGVTPPGEERPMPEATRRAINDPIEESVLFLSSEAAFTEEFRREQPRRYERYVRLRSTATRLEASRAPRQMTVEDPTREEMAERVGVIRSPMQIVVGDRDWLHQAALALHERVAGSRLAVLPAAPHNAYFQLADEWTKVVRAFLDEVVPG